MTPEQTIILNRIKDEVSEKNGYGTWKSLLEWHNKEGLQNEIVPDFIDEVCQRYAEAMNKELVKQYQDLWLSDPYVKVHRLEQEIERLKVSRQKSCEASLEKAAENAKVDWDTDQYSKSYVIQESITDTSNIVIIE